MTEIRERWSRSLVATGVSYMPLSLPLPGLQPGFELHVFMMIPPTNGPRIFMNPSIGEHKNQVNDNMTLYFCFVLCLISTRTQQRLLACSTLQATFLQAEAAIAHEEGSLQALLLDFQSAQLELNTAESMRRS